MRQAIPLDTIRALCQRLKVQSLWVFKKLTPPEVAQTEVPLAKCLKNKAQTKILLLSLRSGKTVYT